VDSQKTVPSRATVPRLYQASRKGSGNRRVDGVATHLEHLKPGFNFSRMASRDDPIVHDYFLSGNTHISPLHRLNLLTLVIGMNHPRKQRFHLPITKHEVGLHGKHGPAGHTLNTPDGQPIETETCIMGVAGHPAAGTVTNVSLHRSSILASDDQPVSSGKGSFFSTIPVDLSFIRAAQA
jgi:hypothetical protein